MKRLKQNYNVLNVKVYRLISVKLLHGLYLEYESKQQLIVKFSIPKGEHGVLKESLCRIKVL